MNKLFAVWSLTLGMLAGFAPGGAGAQQGRLPDFADLVEKAAPAVVNIRTTERARASRMPQFPMPEGMDENDPFYDFFRRFFPPRRSPGPDSGRGQGQGQGEEVPRGVGSGFIISGDGYLMTNHHVVDGADEIYVTLADKREFKGRLIGSDRRTDIALVKIEATDLPRLAIGDSQRLRVGEWVVAIGSPFGLDSTVTAGIVSAKSRDTGDYLPFIQTDVAVNPGNSGGPLLNMAGEVVGINSQIYSRTGGFMGISFAIPIDEAMRVVEQLRTSGRVIRGRIGVAIAEVTREVATPLGLPKAEGALVRVGLSATIGGKEVTTTKPRGHLHIGGTDRDGLFGTSQSIAEMIVEDAQRCRRRKTLLAHRLENAAFDITVGDEIGHVAASVNASQELIFVGDMAAAVRRGGRCLRHDAIEPFHGNARSRFRQFFPFGGNIQPHF